MLALHPQFLAKVLHRLESAAFMAKLEHPTCSRLRLTQVLCICGYLHLPFDC